MRFLALLAVALLGCAFSPAGSPVKSPASSPVISYNVAQPAAQCAITPDWENWDGTNDGTLETDVTGTDEWNTGEYAQLGDHTALHVYAKTSDGQSTYQLMSAIVTTDPCTNKDITLGTPTELIDYGTNLFGQADLVKLSDTRFLAFAGNPSGHYDIILLDQTGAIIDHKETENLSANGRNDLTAHSSTVAVASFRYTDSDAYLMGISVSGDTINYTSATEYLDGVVSDVTAVTAMNAGRGLAFSLHTMAEYTLSGYTPTVISTARYDVASAGNKKSSSLQVGQDALLATYLDVSANGYISYISAEGIYPPSRLDTINYSSDQGNWKAQDIAMVQPYVENQQDGYYLIGYQDTNNTDANVALISWNGSGLDLVDTITAATATTAAEHVSVFQMAGREVILTYQDSVYWDWKLLVPEDGFTLVEQEAYDENDTDKIADLGFDADIATILTVPALSYTTDTGTAYSTYYDGAFLYPMVMMNGPENGAAAEDSCMATQGSSPERWVRLDLGAIYNVTGVFVANITNGSPGGWNPVYTYSHSLQYSSNGTDWVDIDADPLAGTWPTDGGVTNEFVTDIDARYVRLYKESSGSPSWVNVCELYVSASDL